MVNCCLLPMFVSTNFNVMTIFKTLFSIAFLMIVFLSEGKSQVNPASTYVSGYTKADGTYVSGYYKTVPNTTNRDNYTTKPNVNPYTGTAGYIKPDNKPSASVSSYSNSNYSVPVRSNNSNYPAPISTGTRGGPYYMNSNGNKTYIRRN